MPWIVRIQREKELWGYYKKNNFDKIKEEIEILEKQEHKTPANLVVRFIKNTLKV